MTRDQFIQLYDSQADSIAKFLSFYVSERVEIEDLLQEVFLRIWKYKAKVSLEHQFLRSYLLKTARNVALTYLTKKKRDIMEQCERLEKEPIDEQSNTGYTINELDSKYSQALKVIPNKARTVYLMSREDGLSYKEIAQDLDISPKTVEVHISKALKVLRQEFYQSEI